MAETNSNKTFNSKSQEERLFNPFSSKLTERAKLKMLNTLKKKKKSGSVATAPSLNDTSPPPLLWLWFSHFCIFFSPQPWKLPTKHWKWSAKPTLSGLLWTQVPTRWRVCFKYQSPPPHHHQPFTIIHENDDSLHTDLQAPSREEQRRMNLNSWTMKSKLVMKAWNLVALTYFLFCFCSKSAVWISTTVWLWQL